MQVQHVVGTLYHPCHGRMPSRQLDSHPRHMTRTCSQTDRMARSLIPLLALLPPGLDSTMYSCWSNSSELLNNSQDFTRFQAAGPISPRYLTARSQSPSRKQPLSWQRTSTLLATNKTVHLLGAAEAIGIRDRRSRTKLTSSVSPGFFVFISKEREVEVDLWQLPFTTQARWCGISVCLASEHNANTNSYVEKSFLYAQRPLLYDGKLGSAVFFAFFLHLASHRYHPRCVLIIVEALVDDALW